LIFRWLFYSPLRRLDHTPNVSFVPSPPPPNFLTVLVGDALERARDWAITSASSFRTLSTSPTTLHCHVFPPRPPFFAFFGRISFELRVPFVGVFSAPSVSRFFFFLQLLSCVSVFATNDRASLRLFPFFLFLCYSVFLLQPGQLFCTRPFLLDFPFFSFFSHKLRRLWLSSRSSSWSVFSVLMVVSSSLSFQFAAAKSARLSPPFFAKKRKSEQQVFFFFDVQEVGPSPRILFFEIRQSGSFFCFVSELGNLKRGRSAPPLFPFPSPFLTHPVYLFPV